MGKNILILILFVALLALGYVYVSDTKTTATTVTDTKARTEKTDVCAQVLTSARDPQSGDIKEFPTPCDVPKGWELIENEVPGMDLEVQ